MGPLNLLVLQGTPFCNIDCNYCYLPDRLDKTRMPFDVISKTLDRVIEGDILKENFTILWHAGEPLVLPISFYKEAFRIVNDKLPLGITAKQSIQTNAMLLNQDWCDFIKANNIEFGISIDGPELFHDKNRVDRKGKGTFKQVMKGIELLKKNDIPLRAITVLTKDAALFPDELFHFYKDTGISYIGFNIDEIEADNKTSSHINVIESEEIIYSFFERFLKLHKLYNKPFIIREFQDTIAKLALAPLTGLDIFEPDSLLLTPFRIVTVGTNGDYSTFCPELLNYKETEKYGTIRLGNVFHDSFSDAIKTSKFIKIYSDILLGIESCRNNCEYFGMCQAGYPSNKLGEKGSFAVDETLNCRLIKKIPIDVVLNEALEEIISFKKIVSTGAVLAY